MTNRRSEKEDEKPAAAEPSKKPPEPAVVQGPARDFATEIDGLTKTMQRLEGKMTALTKKVDALPEPPDEVPDPAVVAKQSDCPHPSNHHDVNDQIICDACGAVLEED